MKGPAGRVKFDVRRVWHCPACQRRDQTPGSVVHRACPKCSDAARLVWMVLVEPGKSRGVSPVLKSMGRSIGLADTLSDSNKLDDVSPSSYGSHPEKRA